MVLIWSADGSRQKFNLFASLLIEQRSHLVAYGECECQGNNHTDTYESDSIFHAFGAADKSYSSSLHDPGRIDDRS